MTKSVLVGDQMIQSVRGQVLSRCADMSISGRSEYKIHVFGTFFQFVAKLQKHRHPGRVDYSFNGHISVHYAM